jgi:hypothetical protein
LLHGDILQAAAYNVIFLAALPFCLGWGMRRWYAAVRASSAQSLWRLPVWVIRLLLGLLIVFWIVRNLNFYPCNLLAPHSL